MHEILTRPQRSYLLFQCTGLIGFLMNFKYCLDQISAVCADGEEEKLRNLIFEQKTTNAFPAVFSAIFVAFHELFVGEKMKISSRSQVKKLLKNITKRIDTSRGATKSTERRKNVETIKAIIRSGFATGDPAPEIYENHSSSDIDASIRRSKIELNNYDLKQGVLRLHGRREIDDGAINGILATICAIANNGPDRTGKVIIGVADGEDHANRVKELDSVVPRAVGDRFVVGVDREARVLGVSLEQYNTMIRNQIASADLSEPLKTSVQSSIDYNSYYGLGVIVISTPPQKEPAFFENEMYWRDCDNTLKADTAKKVADISRRF